MPSFKCRSKFTLAAAGFLSLGMLPHTARASEFCVVQGAWTCSGPGAIAPVEHLWKMEEEGISGLDPALNNLAITGRCDGPAIVSHQVTVLFSNPHFAFFCERVGEARGALPPTFDCAYAKIDDLRTAAGAPVTEHDLKEAAAGARFSGVNGFAACGKK